MKAKANPNTDTHPLGKPGNYYGSRKREVHRPTATQAVRDTVKVWSGRNLAVAETHHLRRALEALAKHEPELEQHSPAARRLYDNLKAELAKPERQ